MRYVLIGYKLDESRGEKNTTVYDIDILDYSDDEIFITDDDKKIYHQYDLLKVYIEK